ncbi:MAG: metal-dependent hydrolase [Kiritimatiellae bacterium]|nr:metal-dependent hydrolase [Kiritimatiellia bacterium]MDD5520548.1 metal-dependent hydrolase [Kiritimatiellia bacterium]
MKGIAHFSVGIALASFFQQAVQAGSEGNPLYFILGGVFGLLPDTLDFKFYKFLYKRDIEISPDPKDPDPQVVADGLAFAVNKTFDTGKPVRIKLNTIRLGSDLWRQYKMKFDVGNRKVIASIGPVVRTDQSVVKEYSGKEKKASATLVCGIKPDYEVETTIDILDGPLFMMTPSADGRIIPAFIPWHREWSHSFIVGLLFALVGAVAWSPLAGVISFFAYGAHILLDQLGFLGSNLFYPFHASRRAGGMKLIHSGDMLPNFGTVWLSCLAIFWNLYRDLSWQITAFNPLKLVFYGVIIPLTLFILLRRFLVARNSKPGVDAERESTGDDYL